MGGYIMNCGKKALYICLLLLTYPLSSATLSWNNLYRAKNLAAPHWNPGSTALAFTVNDPVTRTSAIYLADIKTGELTKLVESEKGFSLINNPWSSDAKRLYFIQGNSINEVDIQSKRIKQFVRFAGHSKDYVPQVYFGDFSPSVSSDGSRIAFSWESEIYTFDVDGGGFNQVTHSHPEGWHNYGPKWSPDGSRLLFTSIDTKPQSPFLFLTFEKIMGYKKGLIGLSDIRLGIIPWQGGETIWLAPDLEAKYSLRSGSNVSWSPDGTRILINKISLDHTQREIIVADSKTGRARIIHTEKVPHWISPLAIWVKYSPDGKKILFTSEKTGWNHIYVIPEAGGEPTQITDGSFTVVSNQVYDMSEITPVWSRDGQRIYFPSNEGDTSQKHFYVVDAGGRERTRLTSLKGVNSNLTISPDEKKIAFFHSDLDRPQGLFLMDNEKLGKAVQLTDLYLPDELKNEKWVKKEIIRYKNVNDGTEIAAILNYPADFRKGQKYPAVIFAHGAGYTQNVYMGNWGERFLFNEYLAQNGYVVLAPDFRGSAGYGEKFRMDVFNDLGFIDLDDVLFGVEYLKGLGIVDEKKIGIWGHSYGGFMTCMAMFRAPDVFKAGAAGAPVTDWERFFYLAPGYNEEHFGFPWVNPEGTKRSSPLHYAKELKNPFLLLSGIQDTMHLDAEVLVQELLNNRKKFEVIFYPNDDHSLRTAAVQDDKWRRIFEFFERNLKLN